MSDDIWKRPEIESPCINVCVVHPTERLCTGCFRTIDEISRWSAMSGAERTEITKSLSSRAPRLKKRRGGRAARLKR
jgi:uncharacterized protein